MRIKFIKLNFMKKIASSIPIILSPLQILLSLQSKFQINIKWLLFYYRSLFLLKHTLIFVHAIVDGIKSRKFSCWI